MLNIEKVDPHLVRLVLERTSKDFVHHKDDPQVDRDGRHKEREPLDPRILKRRIARLNRLFAENGVDLYLAVAEDEAKRLEIRVYEKSTGKLIKRLSEEEIDRILNPDM